MWIQRNASSAPWRQAPVRAIPRQNACRVHPFAGSGGGGVAYDGEEDDRMAPMPEEMLQGPGSVPRRPPSDVFGPRESLGLPISSGGLDLGSLPTPGSSLGYAAGHPASHAFGSKPALGTFCLDVHGW